MHVPLVVKRPGKLPGRGNSAKVVDAQVRTIDILPTVTELLRIPPPEVLDGASLQAYFVGTENGTGNNDRTAIGETDYPLRFGWAPLRSVRAEGFKFIEAPRPELYDLHTDPGELANQYQAANAAANATVQKFRGMLAEAKAKAPQPASADANSTVANDQLKALGYQRTPDALGPATAGGAAQLPDPLADPKDKIEEQNLLHTAMMASDDNRAADAQRALEKVLALDPKSPTALRQLGELELKAADYFRAAEHLKLAKEARPEDSTAAFYEGQARQKAGDLAGARDALEASLKLMPGQFPARLLLGQVYLGLKDANNAADQFEAALLLKPKSVEAQAGLKQAEQLKKAGQ
jgi:Flp pilus assembly protein TadD